MDKSWLIICRAAATLTKMKRSKLDEPTAKKLRELIYEDDIIDAHHQVEEKEAGVDEVFQNHEIVENRNKNITGFGVNPEFIRKLKCGKITVESLILPPLGQAIDGSVLPKVPPIETLQGQIGNCSVPFEKQLTTTDLDMGQGRVAFCKMAVEELLIPMLKTREDLTVGINVTVYNEKGRGFPMSFRYWSNKIYVLTTGWNKFAPENELKLCEDWVTVWMFRYNYTDELCFAIIPRRFPITKLIGKPQKKGGRKGKEKEDNVVMQSRTDDID